MTVRVTFHTRELHVLVADLETIPNRATHAVADAVETTAKHGNTLGKNFARKSAGAHGKHYHKAFSVEKAGLLGLSWVYGPLIDRPQGGMSFENGSRNQPPHHDLAKSADIIGPELSRRIGDAVQSVMW